MKDDKYLFFDLMIEGVQVIDRDFRYLYVNEVTERQSKFRRDELVGHSMSERYPGIESTELYKQINTCIKDGTSSKTCNEFIFPDGSSGFFNLSIQPIPEGVLILSIDITEQKAAELAFRNSRKVAEERIQQINAELEAKVKERTRELIQSLQSEKDLNEMKSGFVSMASHEFRSPLTTILSSTVLLERYVTNQENEKCFKHLARIKNSINAMIEILDDFLSLDKLEQGKVIVVEEKLDFQNLVQEIIDDLENFCKAGQQIRWKHNGRTETIIDKKIVKNILLNLLSNAIKYSDADIELTSDLTENNLIISVKDKGIGIPEEELNRIFKKYFRSSNTGTVQGTGLGLNIVKRYVELINGSISFQSKLNQGTQFTLHIPQHSNVQDGPTVGRKNYT